MKPAAVMVDCRGDVVKECDVMGRAKLAWITPKREFELHTTAPHRHDIVDRVFEIDGRAADGETWIYRETHWRIDWCDCWKELR